MATADTRQTPTRFAHKPGSWARVPATHPSALGVDSGQGAQGERGPLMTRSPRRDSSAATSSCVLLSAVAIATGNSLVTHVLRSVHDMSVSAVARSVQD
jgi:hypothetical protein